MTRRVLVPFLTIAIVMSVGLASPAQTSSSAGKIAPRVLAETQNGKTTEALVVLSEQADLRPAYSLPTKEEKGEFVVNTLREVANRTQGPIVRMLDSLGVSYQRFYIVNMIEVTGGRALMEQLAARGDVAHIDANPHVRTALPRFNHDRQQRSRFNHRVEHYQGEGAGCLEPGISRRGLRCGRCRHRCAVGPSCSEEPLSRLEWPERQP